MPPYKAVDRLRGPAAHWTDATHRSNVALVGWLEFSTPIGRITTIGSVTENKRPRNTVKLIGFECNNRPSYWLGPVLLHRRIRRLHRDQRASYYSPDMKAVPIPNKQQR
ncbi:hypothetical protein J6590_013112 [Homalodisca vitripennis]|nr:hypothetical protein J6590_013112 [Homalodisca vitripennis]